MEVRPEKYISIYSDSQATLKALLIAKTMSPLVQECQKALNDISTGYSVGLFWFPRHSRVCGKEITIQLLRGGTIHQFVGPELALGVSRQNIRKKYKMLDGQAACGNVVGSCHHSETCLKI
jgi:hypothetical protein